MLSAAGQLILASCDAGAILGEFRAVASELHSRHPDVSTACLDEKAVIDAVVDEFRQRKREADGATNSSGTTVLESGMEDRGDSELWIDCSHPSPLMHDLMAQAYLRAQGKELAKIL
jgi:hypothetical protein